MALARFRVLSLISKNGTIHPHHQYFRRIFSSLSSPSLPTRLLDGPISRIRARLDSQLNNGNHNNNFSGTLKTLEISWDDLITRLGHSSPKKVQLGMLVWLCEARRLDKVSELLKFILDGGWEINVYMAEKLVWLYTELWRKEEMEELLLDLARSNQALEVQSRVHAGIIRMNAKVDCLDDVEYSVGRMLKQGMTFTCPDDVEKVICSYFRREAHDRLDLFLECIKGTYKLTRSTYELLAAGYRRVGLYEKLDRVVNDMKLAGLS